MKALIQSFRIISATRVPVPLQKRFLIILCLLALSLNLFFFVISVRNVPASSDEAICALQALDIRGGQRPLLMLALPYQLPLESYLTAPIARCLPANAFGARLIPALLGLVAVALTLLTLRRLLPLRGSWPGALLILIPPAYLLMLQVAYAMPQHSTMILLTVLIAWLATFLRGPIWRTVALSGLIGVLSGLAFSNHMLALPLLVMAALMVGMNASLKASLASVPAFVAGALLGLAPHFAANRLFPNAHQAVSLVLSWADIRALVAPMFAQTLPGAFGINPCLFPDDDHQVLNLFSGLALPFSALWVLLLLAVTGLRLVAFIRATIRNRWPTLEVWDFFLGISWMAILLYLGSARSQSHSYRYLLLAVWSFPFLVCLLYAHLRGVGRWAVGTLVVGLAAVNLVTGAALMRQWAAPDFAARVANIFDLRPPLEELRRQGIDRCFASFWVAYRINYESRGAVVASQPMNERFPRWPIPYKEQVLAADRVAYVLAPNTMLLWNNFAQDMAVMGVSCRVTTAGQFRVCTDFTDGRDRQPVERIVGSELRATASHKQEWAGRMVDGDRASRWAGRQNQKPGMWVECSWGATARVCRVAVYYNGYIHDRAAARDVQLRGPTGWQTVVTNLPSALDAFDFSRGYPIYGEQVQLIRLEPQLADAVRLVITEPYPGRNWSIGEFEVYRMAD